MRKYNISLVTHNPVYLGPKFLLPFSFLQKLFDAIFFPAPTGDAATDGQQPDNVTLRRRRQRADGTLSDESERFAVGCSRLVFRGRTSLGYDAAPGEDNIVVPVACTTERTCRRCRLTLDEDVPKCLRVVLSVVN